MASQAKYQVQEDNSCDTLVEDSPTKSAKSETPVHQPESSVTEKETKVGRSYKNKKRSELTFEDVRDLLDDYEQEIREKRAGTFHPEGKVMATWDMIMMGFLVFTAAFTPFEVAFLASSLNFIFFLNRFVDLFFLVDIFINFRLAYIENNIIIFNHKKIALQYVKGWFLVDVLSTFPFDVLSVVYDDDSLTSLKIIRVTKLMRLVKLMRVFRASRILQRMEAKMSLSYAMLSLYKLAIATCAVIHWGACAWAMAPTLSPNSYNWIEHYDFDEQSIGTQYLASVYWSTMTATTIGYGDIGPQANGERLVAIFLMLIGAMVYALIVGSICQIVSSMDEAGNKYRQTMDNLNRYLAEEGAPEDMQIKLRRYFMQCKDTHRDASRHKVLSLMSEGLRGEFTQHAYGKWIKGLAFLKNAPQTEIEHFNTRMATMLKTEFYPPMEAIINHGSLADRLYIVKSGLCARLGCIISQGKVFGEDVVLHRGRRPYSVRTLTYVSVLTLTKGDLTKILSSGDFRGTVRAIRRYAVRLALSREFVQYAKWVAAQREAKAAEENGETEAENAAERFERQFSDDAARWKAAESRRASAVVPVRPESSTAASNGDLSEYRAQKQSQHLLPWTLGGTDVPRSGRSQISDSSRILITDRSQQVVFSNNIQENDTIAVAQRRASGAFAEDEVAVDLAPPAYARATSDSSQPPKLSRGVFHSHDNISRIHTLANESGPIGAPSTSPDNTTRSYHPFLHVTHSSAATKLQSISISQAVDAVISRVDTQFQTVMQGFESMHSAIASLSDQQSKLRNDQDRLLHRQDSNWRALLTEQKNVKSPSNISININNHISAESFHRPGAHTFSLSRNATNSTLTSATSFSSLRGLETHPSNTPSNLTNTPSNLIKTGPINGDDAEEVN